MNWLVVRTARRAPRRLLLDALGVAFPVAMLGATLLFIDASTQTMTDTALRPVQVEMRAQGAAVGVDMNLIDRQLAAVPGVTRLDRFASAGVAFVSPSGGKASGRLFAVDPSYFEHHAWVKVLNGSLGQGILITQSLRAAPGFADAAQLSIQVAGEAPPIILPVAGIVDLKDASTWFGIPGGSAMSDVAVVPRDVVVDYTTFDQKILPALRSAIAAGAAGAISNAGSTELPAVSMEAHITIDHTSYPRDPGLAFAWSSQLRRQLELRGQLRGAGSVIVYDNGAEALDFARADATNAKILFLFLGLPGAVAAAAVAVAAASALTEAQRREYALLELRGATPFQLARLGATAAFTAAILGIAIGMAVATLGVSLVVGRPPWQGVPLDQVAISTAAAAAAGVVTLAIRVGPLLWRARRGQFQIDRRYLAGGRDPFWKRARLDLVALGVALAVLGVTIATGGLTPSVMDPGPALAMSFYVLLAPIALWLGATLLAARALLALLGRATRPDRARPLSSLPAAALRWLGRRPGRATSAAILGALAIAFGTEVLSFVDTYSSNARIDDAAAVGADLRITPVPGQPVANRPSSSMLAGLTPVRVVPVQIGQDRKTLLAIDPASFQKVVNSQPTLLQGEGVKALADNPNGILVAREIAVDFSLNIGDTINVTIYPDAAELASDLTPLTVVGVFRTFAPTEPPTEVVTSTAALPLIRLPAPDFYLGRVANGTDVSVAASELSRHAGPAFRVSTLPSRERDRRAITSLNLTGLGLIAAVGAGLVAALGVAVLGAFLVLERGREIAVFQAIGTERRQLLLPPSLEAAAVVGVAIVVGVPLGIGLAILALRVLGLFFTMPPPLVDVPVGPLLALIAGTLVGCGGVIVAELAAVARIRPAETLREL